MRLKITIIIIAGLLMSLILKILLPVGDEPDFNFRVYQLTNIVNETIPELSLLLNYYIDIVHNAALFCNSTVSPIEVFSHIKPSECLPEVDNIILAFLRYIFTIVLFIPILRRRGKDCKYRSLVSNEGLMAAFLMPSFIFYVGLMSTESLVLLLQVIALLYIDRKIIFIILTALMMIIDPGNTTIFLLILVFIKVFELCGAYNLSKKSILFMMSMMCASYIVGIEFVNYLSAVDLLASKATNIYKHASESGILDKYPVVLRPVITFISFVMYLPGNAKFLFSYIFAIVLIAHVILFPSKRVAAKMESHDYRREQYLKLICLIVIATIISIVFMFPTYANAKYYIFTLPIFCSYALIRIGNKFYYYLFLINLFAIIHLMLIYSQ